MKDPDRETAEGILYTDQYQLTMGQLYFRPGKILPQFMK